MSRLSLSDVVEAQGHLLEKQRFDIERLLGVVSDVLTALTENRKPTAAESVTLKRAGAGEKVTTAEVVVVVQEGETIQQAAARGAEVYEVLAARYPLPSGVAHLSELGKDDALDAWRKTLEMGNGAGLHAVPDPEPKK